MKLESYLFIVFAVFVSACNGNKVNKEEADAQSSVDAETIIKEDVTDGAVYFIKEMYNNVCYENYAFLEKHCSADMLKKLEEDYENEGGGYAVWDFRSGAQDGPSDLHEIISVTPEGDDWYKYEFYDMGIKGSHEIQVIQVDGEYLINDLK